MWVIFGFQAKVGKTGRDHAKDVILLAKPDSAAIRTMPNGAHD
jgi:hypothetical protein